MKAKSSGLLPLFLDHLSVSNGNELDVAVEIESNGIVCVEQNSNKAVCHPFVSTIHQMFGQPTQVDGDALEETPENGGEEDEGPEEQNEDEEEDPPPTNAVTASDQSGTSSKDPVFGSLEVKTLDIDEESPIRKIVAYGKVTHFAKV
jgi:hypothetical protein